MADEADPGNVLAVKNIGSRAADRPALREAKRPFGNTALRLFFQENLQLGRRIGGI